MLVILTPRLEKIECPDGDIINLYIVPKTIKDERQIRSMLRIEFNSCHKKIYHMRPLLVGNYCIKRHDLYKYAKEDAIIGKHFHHIVVKHFSFKNINVKDCFNLSRDICMRMQFIMKPCEMNNMIGWEKELDKNLIDKKGICYLRPKAIPEE